MSRSGHTMKKVAVITGASGGIGKELAMVHAREGGDLILVARGGDKLEEIGAELREKIGVKVQAVPLDLAAVGAAEELYRRVEELGVEVELLVNNAGFGGHGFFHERDWSKDREMITLNVMTLTGLTRLFLPGMIARRRGRVLNVASAAGFIPGPLQAVYYATKAYVVSLTEALANELDGTGVTATALCPGATQTDFAARGELDGVAAFKNAARADDVAEFGYRAMMKGKSIAVHGVANRLGVLVLPRLLTRDAVTRISRSTMEKAS